MTIIKEKTLKKGLRSIKESVQPTVKPTVETIERGAGRVGGVLEKGIKRTVFGRPSRLVRLKLDYRDMRGQTLKQKRRMFGGKV